MTTLAGQEGAHRRRASFFRGTLADDVVHDVLSADHPLMHRARAHLSIAVQDIALSRGLGNLPPGDLATLVDLAAARLGGMPPDALRNLTPSSPALFEIASTTIAPFITQDAIDRARLEQARASLIGTGVSLTDDQLMRGIRSGLDAAARTLLAARGGVGDRYGDLSGTGRLSTSEAQTIASARSLANELGMAWALNNPELLRLGPSAIRTLHEAGLRRESFERMTSDRVGIRAETTVHFAAWARGHNLTPEQTNRLADSTSDLHGSLSSGYPPEERRRVQRELDRAFDRFVTGPNTPEARRALEEERMRHARTEQQREQIRSNNRELEAALRSNATATVQLNQDRRQNERSNTAREEMFDGPAAPAQTEHRTDKQTPAQQTSTAAENTENNRAVPRAVQTTPRPA